MDEHDLVVWEQVTADLANHVLAATNGAAGGGPWLEGGSFTRPLLEAFFRADMANFARLEGAFPVHGLAVRVYKNVPGGVGLLMERARDWKHHG